MKKLVFLIIFLPVVTFAQQVVILSVNQPPELGLTMSQTDTTILETTSVELGTDLVVDGGSGDYKFLWTPGETLSDSTILNPVSIPSDTTTYSLTVTDEFGCSFSVNYTVNVRGPMVGVDVFGDQTSLMAILFPNPSDGNFKVQLTGPAAEKIELAIVDSNGRLLKRQTVNNFNGTHTENLLVNLVNGIYTLRINSGNEILSRQFIIH